MKQFTIQQLFLMSSVIFSIAWISIVLIFKYRKQTIKRVITQNPGYVSSLETQVIAPREFIVNLFYDKNEMIDFEMFADMSMSLDELKKGTYKIPNHDKSNVFEIIETKHEPKEEKRIITIEETNFEEYININKKKFNH